PMNLDTLHVDAGREMVSLIWRGIANVSDIDWLECRDILIVSEPLSAPQPMEALIAQFDAGDDDDEPADEVETPEQREERIKQFHKEVDEAEKLVEQHLNQTVAQAQAKIKSHFDISKATVPPGDMK